MPSTLEKPKEYWIFADESEQDGLYYSNFFGGIIIPQVEYNSVRDRLLKKKRELGLGTRELKWQKVSAKFEEEYRSFVDAFFEEIYAGHIRMRVMFRKNSESLDSKVYRKQERYTKLYYQFLKHAFGLKHAPVNETGYRLRFYLDELPDTKAQIKSFKHYVAGLPSLQNSRVENIVLIHAMYQRWIQGIMFSCRV